MSKISDTKFPWSEEVTECLRVKELGVEASDCSHDEDLEDVTQEEAFNIFVCDHGIPVTFEGIEQVLDTLGFEVKRRGTK